MWNDQDRQGFNEASANQYGQFARDCDAWNVLREAGANTEYKTFLEVGTWNGLGSTRAFVEGMRTRAHSDFVFYSLECNTDKHLYALGHYVNDPNVHIMNSVLARPSKEEIRRVFPQAVTENGDLHIYAGVDNHNISSASCTYFWDTPNLPKIFDVVLLDGGEYTTWFDFLSIKDRANVIILDDAFDDKCIKAHNFLCADPEWRQTAEMYDKGCTSVFVRNQNLTSNMPTKINGMSKKVRSQPYTKVPVVIHHTGGTQDYFLKNIQLSSRENDVLVIGDQTNKQSISGERVQFVDIDTLQHHDIEKFRKCFVNFSFQPENFERECFLRVFYLRELMKQRNLDRVFYLDSDCALLCNISDFLHAIPEVKSAYSKQKDKQNENIYHMTGCIHNAVLTMDACNKYIKLCFDIYDSQKKMSLIDDKWKHHKEVSGGGVCDMTLWYLFDEQCDNTAYDTNELYLFEGDTCSFDHNINDSYGFDGNNTYVTTFDDQVSRWAETKRIVKKDNKFYMVTKDDKLIRALTLHYQGGAKEGLGRNVHSI